MTFRDVLQNTYLILLRFSGAAVIGFSVFFLFMLGSPDHPGIGHLFPMMAMVLNLIVALAYLVPRLSPRWLTHPQGLLPGLGVGLLHCVTPFLFMIPVMGGVIAMGFEEPLSQHLAVGATLILWLIVGAMWWLGVILSIWRVDPPAVVPTFTRPPLPRAPVDARALRKSRST